MILLEGLVFPAQEYAGKTICGLSKKLRRLPEQPGTFPSMGTAPACILITKLKQFLLIAMSGGGAQKIVLLFFLV